MLYILIIQPYSIAPIKKSGLVELRVMHCHVYRSKVSESCYMLTNVCVFNYFIYFAALFITLIDHTTLTCLSLLSFIITKINK